MKKILIAICLVISSGFALTAMAQSSSAAIKSHVNPIDIQPISTANLDAINTLEQSFFDKHGYYLQILPGRRQPSGASKVEAQELQSIGSNVPSNARIDVYEAPQGFGYQVTYVKDGVSYTEGYGPEAKDRTYSFAIPQSATSTTAAVANP